MDSIKYGEWYPSDVCVPDSLYTNCVGLEKKTMKMYIVRYDKFLGEFQTLNGLKLNITHWCAIPDTITLLDKK